MGEQVTYGTPESVEETVSGNQLLYIEKSHFDSLLKRKIGDDLDAIALLADMVRLNALYMVAKAGSGHLGSSFSSIDIVTYLYAKILSEADSYYSSKGHDSPALYAIHAAIGRLDFSLIHKLRRLNGIPGHPDVGTPGNLTNTGALGMGISKAKGFVFADRLTGKSGRYFVMTGDGELQEGQIWESLQSAAYEKMSEITVIVDHNKVQSDCLVTEVSDLGDLESKFQSFGWHVSRVDGHDLSAIDRAFTVMESIVDRPKVLIADTVKGRGVSFMEHSSMKSGDYYKFHSGALTADLYRAACSELFSKIVTASSKLSLAPPALTVAEPDPVVAPDRAQRLIPAYTEALLKLARTDKRIVALDADLVLDTGLIPFKQEFPARFVECGIAEQDMVSRAGAMALKGLTPIVHSFSCFLTTRPNEQIFNNWSERTKVVYVGSLAGLLPGGPGHSHQAVRDIAAISGMPGLIMIEPASAKQVEFAVEWATQEHRSSSYIRLVSIPTAGHPEIENSGRVELGKGDVLREGSDITIIGYGPVMLGEALRSADQLRERGLSVQVINLPWLNFVDTEWLVEKLKQTKLMVTLDNHDVSSGQGTFLRSALLGRMSTPLKAISIGTDCLAMCGRNLEVLSAHEMDATSITLKILKSQEI